MATSRMAGKCEQSLHAVQQWLQQLQQSLQQFVVVMLQLLRLFDI